jgi:hypothetical protein
MYNSDIRYITYVTASLGILGSLYIIFTFIMFKESRTFGTKLVFFLSIADLLHGLEWYPWGVTNTLCTIQGMLMQWSELSYYMWTFCIALCVFQIHYLERDESDVSNLMLLYQVICWFIPMLLSFIPLYEGHYGTGAYDWCWLSAAADDMDMAVLYIPAAGIFVFNTIVFLLVYWRLSSYHSELSRSLSINMTLYVLAFLLAQGPAFVNRIYITFVPDQPQYILYLLQAIFHPLQGFFDSVAYGINEPAFTLNYKMLFIKWGILKNRFVSEQINHGSFSPSIAREEYNYDIYDSPNTSKRKYGLISSTG